MTPDHVNPEGPWPHLTSLARETGTGGKILVERLAIYPDHAPPPTAGSMPRCARRCSITSTPMAEHAPINGRRRQRRDSVGSWLVHRGPGTGRPDRASCPIIDRRAPAKPCPRPRRHDGSARATRNSQLYARRPTRSGGGQRRAGELRRRPQHQLHQRCHLRCRFCAFSKGKLSETSVAGDTTVAGRDPAAPSRSLVVRRDGSLHAGRHPSAVHRIDLHRDLPRREKRRPGHARPRAFPARRPARNAHDRRQRRRILQTLREAGPARCQGLPPRPRRRGRSRHLSDKIITEQWLEVMEAAHAAGFRSTATIMYGESRNRSIGPDMCSHSRPAGTHRRLHRIRPPPFGIWRRCFTSSAARGAARPSARRRRCMRGAVASSTRIDEHPDVMGEDGTGGCRDLPQCWRQRFGCYADERNYHPRRRRDLRPGNAAEAMDALIASIGRVPVQRTTLYGLAPRERQTASYGADPLSEAVNTPAARYARDRDLCGQVQAKKHENGDDEGLEELVLIAPSPNVPTQKPLARPLGET